MKTGAKIEITVTPTVSVKVPVTPKRFANGAKRSSLNILDKIGERKQFQLNVMYYGKFFLVLSLTAPCRDDRPYVHFKRQNK